MADDKDTDAGSTGASGIPPLGPEGDVDASARKRLLSKLAQRLQNPRELQGDAMAVMGAVLESSDRVKTEAVKMVAREVRHYLEELKLKEDIRDLITSHSLEVQLSLSLKPLAEHLGGSDKDEPSDEAPEDSSEDDEEPEPA